MAEPILKLGSKGEAVKKAQKALIERKKYLHPGTEDGIFGPVTQNAVINYQTDRSVGNNWAFSFPLKVDGIVGPATWFRLTPETVKKGSKGGGVRLLQEILKHYADPQLDPGAIDGDFGPHTEAAVKAFQASHVDFDGNPLKADGIVGPKTWAALWS
ncbi:peptidoglycan-binding domain-containing protein [Bradyrhizobium elkanii]|nr:peptidoglycan-binding protein [Bradyrhizobium elkanii]MCP1752011.1 peptidoglycan hydrolase-like protein with peptidoglycan-binding domain [Bradyrhizobium elkanii]MCP1977782.1 peptidoglycan hydrolase-like protein with peptidoglycan-binding domain [Bradyrhizobium elkanii]MCS3887701.1 peptidoglycan hydrolase-like protein with peptidoglycan-binding domain [Bradyrhizobium elkanii]MCS4213280.1 peptidoglycan hydrolase-like protein with peptidoglycan-binding domain [Bradyrhizobium elkanii]MCW221358